MYESHLALQRFVEINNIKRDSNGRCKFLARVEIHGKKGAYEKTKATISFHSGDNYRVRLDEAGDIDADRVHTTFMLPQQSFSTEGGKLIITGESEKMGSYTVTIEKD